MDRLVSKENTSAFVVEPFNKAISVFIHTCFQYVRRSSFFKSTVITVITVISETSDSVP